MRILFVHTGITCCLVDCWRALQRQDGVELRIVIMCVDADSSIDAKKALQGLDCVLFPPAAFDRCDAAEISRQISASLPEGFRPDVVFATGWHSRAVRAVVTDAALAATPKVCCLDMPWRWKFRCIAARFVLRSFLRHYDAVYVPGRLAAVYAKWLGFRRIFKGLLSIDVEKFSHAEESNERRGFLYVGRFAPEKRLDLLCKVYERYRELGGNWHLDLYGAGDAIPRSSTSAPYLSFHPFVQPDGLPQIYRSHACLLLASERDAWPLVVLEARASGCEAIVSDRCGNGAELGARQVPFGNVEAMAREMLTVEREWKGGRIRPQVGLANPYATSYDCKAWAKRTLEIARRTCRIRGFCPGMDEPANGMAVVARLLAQDEAFRDDYIVHGMWLPRGWWVCLRHFGNYVRMTHGSLSPLYLEHQGKWKKRLVRPIERFLLRHARKVLATCETEAEWIRAYEERAKVEVVDLKRFFDLNADRMRDTQSLAKCHVATTAEGLRHDGISPSMHLLYLGRRHPLKGVEYLEKAVAELKEEHPLSTSTFNLELRIVSNAVGAELEKVWEWCDVLVLPTLSENFGLVVAEALEQGKRVVTTDGAPVWEGQPGVVYLKGYREGTDEERVELLKRGLRESGSGKW